MAARLYTFGVRTEPAWATWFCACLDPSGDDERVRARRHTRPNAMRIFSRTGTHLTVTQSPMKGQSRREAGAQSLRASLPGGGRTAERRARTDPRIQTLRSRRYGAVATLRRTKLPGHRHATGYPWYLEVREPRLGAGAWLRSGGDGRHHERAGSSTS